MLATMEHKQKHLRQRICASRGRIALRKLLEKALARDGTSVGLPARPRQTSLNGWPIPTR